MSKIIHYGIGGYCEICNPEVHGHPLHNMIFEEEILDLEPVSDITQIAEALVSLPQEALDALKQALGLSNN